MKDASCTIVNKTKSTQAHAGVPFVSIKNKILGSSYDLSVSFITSLAQRKLNRTYRHKDKTTNILSFPLSKTSGEITFDLAQVKRDAPEFGMSYTKFLKYLFIHGCLHLKGYVHSSTMDKAERKFLAMFS